jgi:hypothetical protein
VRLTAEPISDLAHSDGRKSPTFAEILRRIGRHNSMNNPTTAGAKWDESPSAANLSLKDNASMFQLLFERSADAI